MNTESDPQTDNSSRAIHAAVACLADLMCQHPDDRAVFNPSLFGFPNEREVRIDGSDVEL